MPRLPDGTVTIHELPPGYVWVTDRTEVLKHTDEIEWCDRASCHGFETLSTLAARTANQELLRRPVNAGEYIPACVIRRKVSDTQPPAAALKDILDRSNQHLQARVSERTRIDFGKLYDQSPLNRKSNVVREQALSLMKKVRERVLQQVAGEVHTAQDVKDAYELGLKTATRVRVTAAIEQLSERIDDLANGSVPVSDAEGIRQMILTLKNGVEYLESSFQAATEAVIELRPVAQRVEITNRTTVNGAHPYLWHSGEELEPDTAMLGPAIYCTRHVGFDEQKHWYAIRFSSTTRAGDHDAYRFYRPATPDAIVAAGGKATDNDYLKELT